jgi:glucose/arabinose dehydrogenase
MRIPHLTVVLLIAAACGDHTGPLPPDDDSDAQPPLSVLSLAYETISSELTFPVDLTSPPGDPRLFVVERAGRVRIIRDGTLLSSPFLDLAARVSSTRERGLLGIAFDPEYATNGRFVVNYTDLEGDTHIAAFTVSPTDPDQADALTEQLILFVDQPFETHNGGQVAFGPDGYLYIALGDGGSNNDPLSNGQSLTTLLGKILRIDLNGGSPYGIPDGNPFAGIPPARAEIWSYGLRNPWRFSFDRLTGDLYVADVGESGFEEINVSLAAEGRGAGANYGWSLMEAGSCVAMQDCDRTGLILPALQYDHTQGCSVTGGYVYRGSAIPWLQGAYIHSDFCSGRIHSFRFANGVVSEEQEWPALQAGHVTSFGQDSAGELYFVTSAGGVFRIVEGS